MASTHSSNVSGTGHLDFNANGGLEGGGGTITAGANGISVNIGGGILVSAEPPRLDADGRYIVTWKREYSGKVGGDQTSSNDRKMSASYESKESTTGSRKFDTEAAAKAFYEGGVWASLDPENAGQLQAGDQLAQTDSDQATVGAEGKVMGLTVGANLTVGDTHSVEVTGLGNQRISVKVVDGDVLGGAVSVGAPGVTMSGGLQTTDNQGYIATFDLSTKAGDAAFQYLTQQGQLPPGGQGYTLKADIVGTQREESSGFSVAGVSATNKNTTTETTTTYQDGRTVEERTGTESTGVTVPFFGSHFESTGVKATDDSSAENRAYSVTSAVNSSSTQDVNKGLADATGVGFDLVRNELDNQQSRRWTVTSTFTHAQVERLVRKIRQGNWNHHSLIYESGEGADFAAAVRTAGDDWDQIDRALSEFISETGDSGMRLIRDTLGIRPEYSLALQGDPFMTGEAGHTALANKMRNWTAQLEGQGSARTIGTQIAAEIRVQQTRVDAISDPERYPDLPQQLRGQELARSRREIDSLNSLLERARTAVQQDGANSSVDPTLDPSANSSQMTNAQAVSIEWDAINTFETKVTEKRNQCIETGNEARRAHWIHMGAYAFARSAYATWGETHWYGDDDHASEYASAQSTIAGANELWDEAQELWGDYQEAKANLEFAEPSQIVGTLDITLGDDLVKTFNKYSLARGWYRTALEKYDAIRSLHPEGENNQFYGYALGKQLPPERRLQ